MPTVSPASVARRRFLKQMALGAVWVGGVGTGVAAAADSPFVPIARPDRPVRIRGRVHASGKGLGRVAVTDGLTITQTTADGQFTLVASARQPFVYVSVPAQCEVPVSAHGTAQFYRPIVAGPHDEMSVEFPMTLRRESAERHSFLALADNQTHDAEEMGFLHQQTVPDVQDWVKANQGRPAFGVSVGDIMFDELSLYPEYERAVTSMGLPFFQAVGNHDLDFAARSAELATSTFMRHFGPTYYSFEVGAVHYVVLQNVFYHANGYVSYVDDRQLQWLESDLALVEKGRPVVVFAHIPFVAKRWRSMVSGDQGRQGGGLANRSMIYALLEPFDAHIISGHTHEMEHGFEGGAHEHVIGAVCGAWWSGPICGDGTPNGYAVFDVDGQSLRWTYKATGQPLDYQMRTYAPGSDPTAPDELVANIWHWEPKWQVEWIGDGQPRGPLARRAGLDPMAVQTQTGYELPKRNGWVEPQRTGHLFYAPVGTGTREAIVRATDPFGRVYTSTWRRG